MLSRCDQMSSDTSLFMQKLVLIISKTSIYLYLQQAMNCRINYKLLVDEKSKLLHYNNLKPNTQSKLFKIRAIHLFNTLELFLSKTTCYASDVS